MLGARPLIEAVQRVLPVFAGRWGHQRRCGRRGRGPGLGGRRAVARVPDEGVASFPCAGRCPPRGPTTETRRTCAATPCTRRGHVVCGELLAGRKALQVCARTSQERTGGFVLWDRDTSPGDDAATGHRLAALPAAGAERVVFGADAVSTGCQGDLQMASNLALDLVKETGLGNDRLFHAEHPESPARVSAPGWPTWRHRPAPGWRRPSPWPRARWRPSAPLVDALVAKLQQHGSLGPDAIAAVFLAVRGGEVRPELQLA